MTYRSVIQPHCCNCGKPIAKHTECQWFGQHGKGSVVTELSIQKPATKVEVERLTNSRVVAIRWHASGSYIDQAYLWDGFNYDDEFFCTTRCAVAYANNMARVHKHAKVMAK
jgi:hypothetical protein